MLDDAWSLDERILAIALQEKISDVYGFADAPDWHVSICDYCRCIFGEEDGERCYTKHRCGRFVGNYHDDPPDNVDDDEWVTDRAGCVRRLRSRMCGALDEYE